MQRKMVKWKPFNTLLKYKDILDIERNRNLIDKPVIMEDRIIKIDTLTNLPIAVNIAFSTALVPAISAAIAKKTLQMYLKE